MSGLEWEFLGQVRTLDLPEPVREHHFAWCCEHARHEHYEDRALPFEADGPRVPKSATRCGPCAGWHDYRHDRDWRLDFAWPAEKVAVEIQGGTHSGGRHVRGVGYAQDCEKLNAAVLLGWRVLLFTTEMVEDATAVDTLAELLRQPPIR